jgi:serine/threonine protein kinase
MAKVWLARRLDDETHGAPLVLKTILPCYAKQPEFVAMFLNETKLATQLEHPNIVRVYETGQADACHYIAMEYVAGRTLRQILWRSANFKKLFPVWFALEVAALICDAIEYLHELTDPNGNPLRLLHRDVTPENVMVSFAGEVKLLDFGIARALSLPSLTQVGTLKGKYAYMAPELIDVDRPPADIDVRSDLYSLGVILYEALTGIRPYSAGSDAQLLRVILDPERVATPPSRHATWIPEALDRLVLKSIAKAPEDRFQSARTLRKALRNFMKDTGLCPSSKHISNQVCGNSGSAEDSDPPPSMRLQSPHEVALKLDSGCHALRAPSEGPAARAATVSADSLSGVRIANSTTNAGQVAATEKIHDWDAAIRRTRSDEQSQNTVPSQPTSSEPFGSGTFSIHKSVKREVMELFDLSLERLRHHDNDGALEALRKAALLEPDNRLISTNLRRLEQLNELRETAERGG